MRLGRLCSISWWLSSLISAFEGFSPHISDIYFHDLSLLYRSLLFTSQISAYVTFWALPYGSSFFTTSLSLLSSKNLCISPLFFGKLLPCHYSEGMDFLSPMYKLEAGKNARNAAMQWHRPTAKHDALNETAQPFGSEGPNLHSDFR